MSTTNKLDLYEAIEKEVEVLIGNKNWGYLVTMRNITWGDNSVFNTGGSNFSLPLTTYELDFSHLLNDSLSNKEVAIKTALGVVSHIEQLIEQQINQCNFNGKLKDFKGCIKLLLDGLSVCIDDKVIFKVGIGLSI